MAILQLIGCVLLCQLAGIIGVVVSPTGDSPWYQSLQKPSFNPPSWVFGPVWTILYCLMGIALFRLFRAGSPVRLAIILFLIQLLLNAAWTPVFFRYHQIGWTLVLLMLLIGAVIATIAAALPVSRAAAYLLLPYLAWLLFAGLLNASFWRLNPSAS